MQERAKYRVDEIDELCILTDKISILALRIKLQLYLANLKERSLNNSPYRFATISLTRCGLTQLTCNDWEILRQVLLFLEFTCLDISGNDLYRLEENKLKNLYSLLCQLPISGLNISFNALNPYSGIGWDVCVSIFAALALNSNILHLNLRSNDLYELCDEEMLEFITLLKSTHIVDLDVSENKLSMPRINMLREALGYNSRQIYNQRNTSLVKIATQSIFAQHTLIPSGALPQECHTYLEDQQQFETKMQKNTLKF